jgi:hypothetical protein
MADKSWKISGEYMESCNCDQLCPCIITNPQGPVTYDDCRVIMIFRIDEGECGGVDLSGVCMALVAKTGRVMSDGDWIYGGIVDEKANDAQREVLSAIIGGEAGGPPGMIRQNLVSDFRGVEVKPIEFTLDGRKRAVSIPGMLSYSLDGVESRRGNGEPYYIDNVGHPAGSRLALAITEEIHVDCFGIEFDAKGARNNGHYSAFSWAS